MDIWDQDLKEINDLIVNELKYRIAEKHSYNGSTGIKYEINNCTCRWSECYHEYYYISIILNYLQPGHRFNMQHGYHKDGKLYTTNFTSTQKALEFLQKKIPMQKMVNPNSEIIPDEVDIDAEFDPLS